MKLYMLLPLLFALCACAATEQQDDAEQGTAMCLDASDREMVWIEGGQFIMGDNARYREEGPPREVQVAGFWMSKTEVTNAQYAEFVEATGYRTEAERDPPALPGAPPEMLQPGSAVFRAPTPDNRNWWMWVLGANWRHPAGPESSIVGRDQDPVIHVTYNDAIAYAQWAGLSLPSEEQWEFAAQAGAPDLPEPQDASGKPTANFYQGVFPARDLGEDGFTSRAPVGCFEPNALGLHDMIGNVWEWTTQASRPDQPSNVIKGGSFLCAENYCARYRPAARQFQERDLGTDHIGFRVVDNSSGPPR